MESRAAAASLAIAADSSMGMTGVVVNRSQGVNGNVARANVVALSTSTIAAPPEPSAYPQKPWNLSPLVASTARRRRDSVARLPRSYRRSPRHVKQHRTPPFKGTAPTLSRCQVPRRTGSIHPGDPPEPRAACEPQLKDDSI